MRLSLVLVITCAKIIFSISLVAQELSLEANDQTVREVLRSIENQTSYSILYNEQFSDLDKRISIKRIETDIGEALSMVLSGTGLTYSILDDKIVVISPRSVPRGKTVEGVVISGDDAGFIPGVAVTVPGTAIGTVTDEGGYFEIELPKGEQVLAFQFLGMRSKEIIAGQSSYVVVTMEPLYTQLGEVQVSTGYLTEKKKNLAGAVSNISEKALGIAGVESIGKAMQGKAAGVQVLSASGLPGSSIVVNIRGISSISAGTRPLFIVDGLQMINGSYATYTQTHSLLSALNPEDIQSIDILKDAATAAIYGAQGANGVIIITTKRGHEINKSKVTFSARIGVEEMVRRIDVLNSQQYIELALDGYYNRYGSGSSTFMSFFNNYLEKGWISGLPQDYPDIGYNTNTIPNDDWIDLVFRRGLVQEYMISTTGGSNGTRYYLSLSNNKTQASTKFNYFNRTSLRLNLDHTINDVFAISTSSMVSSIGTRQPEAGGLIANPVRSALMMVPYNSIYTADGTLNNELEGSMHTNPYTLLEQNIFTATTIKLTQIIDLKISFGKYLGAKISGHYDFNDNTERSFLDPRNFQGQALEGVVGVIDRNLSTIQTSATINYGRIFAEKHSVNLFSGYEYKYFRYFRRQTEASGVPTPDFTLLSQAATIKSFSETFDGYKLLGFFGRIGYCFDDKYIINMLLRSDGSSRFSKGRMYGTFPSTSFAWRVSEEEFINDRYSWLGELKVKASYGLVGNSAIDNFISQPQFVGSGHYDGISGLIPSVPGNLGLTWETKHSLNIGMEVGFLKGRIGLEIDYFNDITRDLLYYRGVPTNSGYASIPQNVGSMRNSGLELSGSFVPVETGFFSWNISPNFTWVRNQITSLVDDKQEITNKLRVGYPVNSFLVYNFAGVNPSDGRPMWYDKDGYITYNPVSEDRIWINGIMPTFFGGIVNSFSWKGFELSSLIQFQKGARRYYGDKVVMGRVGGSVDRNQILSMYTEQWQNPGDLTWVAQPMNNNAWIGAGGSSRAFSAASSLHYEKVDYIKLKNMGLSYTIPAKIVAKLKIEEASVSFTGYNLLTTTTYSGYDPEFTGDDTGKYPSSRSYSLMFRITF